jgi:hypothetical protein
MSYMFLYLHASLRNIYLLTPSCKYMGHLHVLKDYVILLMVLRQNEISLPYLPYDYIFTLLHCVNTSLATMVDLMMA